MQSERFAVVKTLDTIVEVVFRFWMTREWRFVASIESRLFFGDGLFRQFLCCQLLMCLIVTFLREPPFLMPRSRFGFHGNDEKSLSQNCAHRCSLQDQFLVHVWYLNDIYRMANFITFICFALSFETDVLRLTFIAYQTFLKKSVTNAK